MTDLAGGLTENLIDCIEALGGARPASKGLSELYQALAVALSTFSGGYPLSDPVANEIGGSTLIANTPTVLSTGPVTSGIWLVTYNVSFTLVSSSSTPKIYLTTSAGGFIGPTSAQFQGTAVSASLSLATLVNPGSSGGTVSFNAESAEADTIISIGSTNPSGWTLTRVQ